MKWWMMLDSVGFMAYMERKVSKRARGIVHVRLMTKCLQRRRKKRAFLGLENFFCSLGWRAWPLDDVVDEESYEGMLATPVPRLGAVSLVQISWHSPLRRRGVPFSVAEGNWSAKVLRRGAAMPQVEGTMAG